ncbi:MAG TPA: TetR/AcrR family transcriptional regulator [Brevundimonas sp.]|jgi:AcrR family transcriptional regulator|uniref:TetR/AcrR family transcriptional regulator n=1 Tax=Brevundimonas sp. TaxID=1871086 RepID=UPI002DF01EDC|nr:TetR/AcrR family transcriptional regulator [Brevundimonas sp.]
MRDVSPSADAGAVMNRRQAAKVRTRGKVLSSARELFAQRGYDPATIRDIAKGAGMSTGAVFANFQDKAELFEAVLAEDLDRVAGEMKTAAEAEGSARKRLGAALTAGYRATLDHLPLVQAVVARAWFHPAEAERRAREAVKPLTALMGEILSGAASRGEIARDADLDLIGGMIWTAFVSGFRRAAYEGHDLKALSSTLERQIDLIFAGARQQQAQLSAA